MTILDTFIGNEKAKQTLAGLLSSRRLPHAILLEGPKGCGKKTFAKQIAMAVVCRAEESPCGKCLECRRVLENLHPDVRIFSSGAAKNSLHIETIREIRADAYVSPNQAEKKVYIIADAQNMTQQAQNAMLKIFEEPPEHAMFILTCETKTALLETILSRALIIPIFPLTEAQVYLALKEKIPGKEEDKYKNAAKISRGSIGNALEVIENEEKMHLFQKAVFFKQQADTRKQYEMIKCSNELEKKKESFLVFLQYLRLLYLEELEHTANHLQQVKNIDIVDEILQLTQNNVNLSLLSTLLCVKIKENN